MAVVMGTNSGFVTAAPSSDPSASALSIVYVPASRCTSPAYAFRITELGFWCDNTNSCTAQIGIYTHNSTYNRPGTRIAYVSVATGGSAGWKKVSGLDIQLDPSTTYWLVLGYSSGSACNINYTSSGGQYVVRDYSENALITPYGAVDQTLTNYLLAVYALVEEISTGLNLQINIGDSWKAVASAKINIGDTWKEVSSLKINIGDVWKDV